MSGPSSDSEVALFDEEDSGSETEYEPESEPESIEISDAASNDDDVDDHDDSGSTVLLLSSNEIEINSGSETDFDEETEEDSNAAMNSRPENYRPALVREINDNVVLVEQNEDSNISNTGRSTSLGRQSRTDLNTRTDQSGNIELINLSQLFTGGGSIRPGTSSQRTNADARVVTSQTGISSTLTVQNVAHGSHQTIRTSSQRSASQSRPGLASQSEGRPGSGSQSGAISNLTSQSGARPGSSSQLGARPGFLAYQSEGRPGSGSQLGAISNLTSQSGARPGSSSQSGARPGSSSQLGARPGFLTYHSSEMRTGLQQQPANQIGAETIFVPQDEEVELMQVEVLTVEDEPARHDPPPHTAVAPETNIRLGVAQPRQESLMSFLMTGRSAEPSRNDSLREFKSPKKPAAAASSSSAVASKDDGNSSDDDAETCIICYEPWTNSGVHRLASLKCGHLFGQSCIMKWLKGQGGKCPQCNAKAKKMDVRVIYAKALRTIDTTDRDRALKDLEKEKELRRKMELEAAQINLKYQMAMEELQRMKTQLKTTQQQQQGMARNQAGFSFSSSQPSTSSSSTAFNPSRGNIGQGLQGQYILDKTVTINQNGGCRVMAFDGANYSLVISTPSSNQLFPGFGIKKISAIDVRNTQYVPIHSKMIRDIDFNGRHDGLMLTASIDKTVKITSLAGNTVVQSYNTEMPAWCCAWNTEDVNYIYAGLQNGTVKIYDTRQTNSEVETLNKEGSRCPIVSLKYVPAAPGTSFWSSGLLTGTLEGMSFWEKIGAAEYRQQKLLDGNCTCLNFDPATRHCMASFRPNKSHPATRHVMCEMKGTRTGSSSDAMVTCNTVQTMYGGTTMKLLTKSSLFDGPAARDGNHQLLVAAGDEASCSALVWDASTGSQAQKLPVSATVLDVCPFNFNRQKYLACLTEKQVKLYRWQARS